MTKARTAPRAQNDRDAYYRLNIGRWQLYYEHGISWRADEPGAKIFTEGPHVTMVATFEKPGKLAGRDMIVRVWSSRDFNLSATSAHYGTRSPPTSICRMTHRKDFRDVSFGLPQDSFWHVIQLIQSGVITKLALKGAPLLRGYADIQTVMFTTAGEDDMTTDLD